MSSSFKRWIILLLGVIAFGAARWPLEQALFEQQRELGLREEEQVSLEFQEQLGQNAFAVALGGYRSVVATWFSLLAFDSWDKLDWDLLEQQYRIATTLQPKGVEYWSLGGWHLAYNASVSYQGDTSLSPAERQVRWRDAIERGSKFFEDGARQNPDSWELRRALGSLWSDPFKITDRRKAFEAYRAAAAMPGAPRYIKRFVFYQQASIDDQAQREEALESGRALWANPADQTTSLLLNLFFLEQELGDPERASRAWFIKQFNQIMPANDEEHALVLEQFLESTNRTDSPIGRELVGYYHRRHETGPSLRDQMGEFR